MNPFDSLMADDSKGRPWYDPARWDQASREQTKYMLPWYRVPGVKNEKEWNKLVDAGHVFTSGGGRLLRVGDPKANNWTDYNPAPRQQPAAVSQSTPSSPSLSADQVRAGRSSLYGNRKRPRRKPTESIVPTAI